MKYFSKFVIEAVVITMKIFEYLIEIIEYSNIYKVNSLKKHYLLVKIFIFKYSAFDRII
jgi:hypothetical protein